MSRRFLLAATLWCCATKLFSADLPLQEELGTAFRQPGVKIVWNTTLDSLPHSAMVFRAVSKQYSPETISNLLEITRFSARDRVTHPSLGNRQFFRDKNNEDRYLGIAPSDGWVYYHDSKAISLPKEVVEGVPSEEQVLKMAEAMVLRLGIDHRELATKPGTQELLRRRIVRERGAFDKAQHKLVKTVTARGVIFIRRIDDIDSGGYGGNISFNFGNCGQLAELDWVWRALKPHRLCRTATRAELTAWIGGGRCVLGGWESLSPSVLNITNATPYYFEKREEEPQQYVYPFVQLDVQARIAETNIPVCLYCPLLRSD